MQEFALARLAPITDGAPRPFWSVVIPTYQRPEMLRQCLDSVLAQAPGPEHMEIIVHEDHGQETAAAVIASCGRGRVRHVRAAAKLHSVPNINAALRSSRGLWTHLLHDDDWVEPGFYEHFRGVLEGQPDGVGACICGLINRPQGRPPDRLRMLQDHAGVMGRFSRSILLPTRSARRRWWCAERPMNGWDCCARIGP